MNQRLVVILGHPRADSLCGGLADVYSKAAVDAGAKVRRINIGTLEFDPLAVQGEQLAPPPEPDILSAQETIRWAQHLVFVYPI